MQSQMDSGGEGRERDAELEAFCTPHPLFDESRGRGREREKSECERGTQEAN